MVLNNESPDKPPFRFSLRYKVALPVLFLVTVMMFMLFQSTFKFVRELVHERNDKKLLAVAEVFRESLKVPLILKNQEVLEATLAWMASRTDVKEVTVEDDGGTVVGSTAPHRQELPKPLSLKSFEGVQRLSADLYGVAVPIEVGGRRLGRLLIVFAQQGLEGELNKLFFDRMLFAFLMGALLAIMTSGVTYLALRPLFRLKRTVQQILTGNLEARARISSFDEIQDLAEAFNEMVSRLARSLDNLHARTRALEESEEKYRLIVDNASDTIFALTSDGEIAFLNEGFSGANHEEILDGGLALFLNLHDSESRKQFEDALERVKRTKESVINVSTMHIHRGNQKEIFYLTNLTPLINHEGKVKLIQGVMRDVTELRRIELMKDSLIRDVAHELKTPTAKFEMAVNWFEQEKNRDPALAKYGSIIEMLKNNSDRLMRTITSIMDLSKLESGALQITREPLDLNVVLTQVIQDMEALCRQKNLELKADLVSEPLNFKGDRDMLYRLFVNLIGNAIKYTPQGVIEVKSYARGPNFFVEVSDSGIGIETHDLETIFERFVQKTASSVGIGVGLTISRDIAALHGAKIWAESAGIGKGAVFKVKFYNA